MLTSIGPALLGEFRTLAERSARLAGKMKDAKARFTVADIRERASQVLEASIENGVSAIRTHSDVDPVIGLKSVEALLELRQEMHGLVDLQIVVTRVRVSGESDIGEIDTGGPG
jgi:cytosine/adenosine deaminase-related metal-dependent hydrolase